MAASSAFGRAKEMWSLAALFSESEAWAHTGTAMQLMPSGSHGGIRQFCKRGEGHPARWRWRWRWRWRVVESVDRHGLGTGAAGPSHGVHARWKGWAGRCMGSKPTSEATPHPSRPPAPAAESMSLVRTIRPALSCWSGLCSTYMAYLISHTNRTADLCGGVQPWRCWYCWRQARQPVGLGAGN